MVKTWETPEKRSATFNNLQRSKSFEFNKQFLQTRVYVGGWDIQIDGK